MNQALLRDRLVSLLLLNPKGFRTDTMATRLGVKPNEVSGVLLPLRAAGEVTTTNDGGDYVIWQAKPALGARIRREIEDERRIEQEELARKVKAANAAMQAMAAARADAKKDSKVDEVKTFILWCPQSDKAPKVTYPSYEKAVEVQATMCKRYPGQSFHVCAVLTGRMVVVEHKLVEV